MESGFALNRKRIILQFSLYKSNCKKQKVQGGDRERTRDKCEHTCTSMGACICVYLKNELGIHKKMQCTIDPTAASLVDKAFGEELSDIMGILAASTECLSLHKCLIFHFSKERTFLLIILESTEMYLGICCFKA